MAKTLDQIINRQDYVKVNSALIERVMELAGIIRKKMKELDLEDILINGTIYKVRRFTSNISWEEHLTVVRGGYGEERDYSLEQNYSEYLHGDFTCRIEAASSSDFLRFLNNARELVDSLDEIETKKLAEINQALESTKDI